MAQAFITGQVRINGVIAALIALKAIDVKPVLRELRQPMHADQIDHREHEQGPRGKWAPLASTTLASYARRGYRRNRRLLARLPNARVATVSGNRLTMRSRVRWSLAHQDGPTRVGRGSIIPQRQFLWISKLFLRKAQSKFNHFLWRTFARKLGWP